MRAIPELKTYTRPSSAGVNYYIEGWYSRNGNPVHFNRRAVNPDDLTEKAQTQPQAEYFALKWAEFIGKGGDPDAPFDQRRAERHDARPRTVATFLDKHWPAWSQEYRYPNRWPGACWPRIRRDFGAEPFDAVTPLRARGWLRDLAAERLPSGKLPSVAFVKRHKEAAQKLWTVAIGEGAALGNPWPKSLKVLYAAAKKQVLTPEQEARLLAACDAPGGQGKRAHVKAALVILIETGLRPESEFFAAVKSQVDLEARIFTAVSHKGRSGARLERRIPISDRALPYFRALIEARSSPKAAVLPADRLFPFASIKRAWKAVCAEAGPDVAGFWLRWLRDTAINRWKEAGLHALDIAALAGHSKPDTTMLYSQPNLAALRSQMSGIEGSNVVAFPSQTARRKVG